MRRLSLGFDIDGVIANFVDALLPRINSERGTSFTELDVHTYQLDVSLGLSPDQIEKYIGETLQAVIHPLPGAIEGLTNLRAQGHSIALVTSRRAQGIEVTQRWLEETGVPHDQLLFGLPKRELVVGIEVFVDDDPRILLELVDSVRHLFVFDHPWNRELETVHRVAHWRELTDAITSLAKDPG